MENALPILRVNAVTKRFAHVTAVEDLSFELRAGEIFALLGPNGAGKTTMVRMLVNILLPDTGTIQFSKQLLPDGGARLPAATLGYLPEERGLYRETAVLRTLEYFGVLHGMDGKAAIAAAKDGLSRFGLSGREKDHIDALSKGNQQKVQYLAATLHEPRFAVLDEPFSGLDPVNQQLFLDEIRRLRDQGCTILLSSHQMDLVESLADRILLMDEGRAVLSGTLEQIRESTRSGARLELGVSPTAALSELEEIKGVHSVTRSAQDRVVLALRPDAAVGDVIRQASFAVDIASVHSAEESLREIFLRTVSHAIEANVSPELNS